MQLLEVAVLGERFKLKAILFFFKFLFLFIIIIIVFLIITTLKVLRLLL